jgi:molecular chaperone GrpE
MFGRPKGAESDVSEHEGQAEEMEAEGVPAEEGAAEGAADAPAEGPTLEEALAERDRIKDQLLRTAADFDNYRKRSRKDVELAERKGRESIIRELLPVVDNLERAIEAAKDEQADVAAIRQGVEMVLKLFEDTSAKIELHRIEAVGARFDPNLHDAIQQEETDEHPPGTVMREVMSGYRLGDKLVRAAMVTVARKPSES